VSNADVGPWATFDNFGSTNSHDARSIRHNLYNDALPLAHRNRTFRGKTDEYNTKEYRLLCARKRTVHNINSETYKAVFMRTAITILIKHADEYAHRHAGRVLQLSVTVFSVLWVL